MQLFIARLFKDYTQHDLTIRTGIPQSKLSLFENGYKKPNEQELKKLAEVLSIKAGELEFDKHELRKQWTAGER